MFVGIAATGCLVDLATKSYMFSRLGMPGDSPPLWIIEGHFGFETALNTGALFGRFRDQVDYLAVFSAVALVGIVAWFHFGKIWRDLSLTWTLGMIAGGIAGNLYDRLGLWSGGQTRAVRDWILIRYSERLSWPNFNIADALLVCGAGVLFYLSWKHPESSETPATASEN